jgi:hypothetical protein
VHSVKLAETKDWDNWFKVSDPLPDLNSVKLINNAKKCEIFSDDDSLILPSDLPADGVCIL